MRPPPGFDLPPETESQMTSRLRHKWSDPVRNSSELSIYTCIKCGLVEHSNHDWASGSKGSHWKSWFEERNPELRLTVMPECVGALIDDSTADRGRASVDSSANRPVVGKEER